MAQFAELSANDSLKPTRFAASAGSPREGRLNSGGRWQWKFPTQSRKGCLGVETHQLMQQPLSILEGIARGEQAIAEGRMATHALAKKRLARWLK